MKSKEYYRPHAAPKIAGMDLYNLRRKYGITRKEFCLWSGLSYNIVDKWEREDRGICPHAYCLRLLRLYILEKFTGFDVMENFEMFENGQKADSREPAVQAS